MFNIGPEKLILLAVLAMVVLGPQRLPEAARALGKGVGELRRLSARLQQEAHGALGEHGEALSEAVSTMRGGLGGVFNLPAATPASPTSPPAALAAAAPASQLAAAPDDPSLN